MESRTPLEVQKIARTFHGRVLANLPDFGDVADIEYWNSHPDELRRVLGNLHRTKQTAGDWIEKLVAVENRDHQFFFGLTSDLVLFRETLERFDEEQVREWKKLGMEPHFLPEMIFTPESDFPGWKVKPNDWYWQMLAAGNLKRRNAEGQLTNVKAARLEGSVVLIDNRLKPPYRDGQQTFANDKRFLGCIIEELRRNDLIQDCKPRTSRFSISANEWQEHVRPKVAEKLGVETAQVRLELVIEANVIPQLYQTMLRNKDGTTNIWVWYEEFLEGLDHRLDGGSSDYGGLARVYWADSDDHWYYRAVRPLGVLAPLSSDT